MYMDAICLIADDADNLRQAIMAMDAEILTHGWTVSTQNTKVQVVGKDAEAHAGCLHILIRSIDLGTVIEFKYLGSIFIADNTIDKEVNPRVAKAGYAWRTLWSQQSGQMSNCF